MKVLLTIIFFSITHLCFSQKSKKLSPSQLEKCVINVWALSNSYTDKEAVQVYNTLKKDGKLNAGDSAKFVDSLKGSASMVSGTAVYLQDGKNKYLVTNRHIAVNEKISEQKRLNLIEKGIKEPSESQYLDIQWLQTNLPMDAFLQGKTSRGSLLYMGTKNLDGLVNISNDTLDIAVLSLQNISGSLFLSSLGEGIYEPFSVSDIDTSDLFVGQDILAIGYPTISFLKDVSGRPYGDKLVVPITTFGKIAMYHRSINNIIGDITSYPGNSGCPVFSGNKMIGIMNGQINTPVSLDTNNNYLPSPYSSRGNLSSIQKAKDIIRLLRELQTKEKALLNENQ